MKAIADTGLNVAFGNRDDAHHEWSMGIACGITEPLLTCEPVLAEAAFHLRSASYVFSLIEDGMLRMGFEITKHLGRLEALAKRYEDRRPDLADLCLIRMSELYPRHTIITVDEENFRIYRRNLREAIPILRPPRTARR